MLIRFSRYISYTIFKKTRWRHRQRLHRHGRATGSQIGALAGLLLFICRAKKLKLLYACPVNIFPEADAPTECCYGAMFFFFFCTTFCHSIFWKAVQVINLELMPQPPKARSPNNPWPHWPLVFKAGRHWFPLVSGFGFHRISQGGLRP